jgi:hypothetical protein
MREKSNGVFSGRSGFFQFAATNKRARQRRRWMAAPCGCSFELTMRLRRGNDDHRSGLARTRRWVRHRTRRGTWGGTRRRRTRHDGRVGVFTIMVMMVVVMAAEGGEGQGAGNQQGEEFTHGHVSFCCGGTITDGFVFVFFRCLYPLI